MKPIVRIAARWFFFVNLVFAVAAFAQEGTPGFEPQVGQPGKDVVWVPTPEDLVARMLDMAKVTASDYVIDLGSGDGRIAIAAGKRGAHALGIEYNPEMVALSNRNAKAAGVADRVKFVKADIFESDFSRATVITMYLLPYLNLRLRPTILSLKPGTRVVSHAFTMEDWEPDQRAMVEGRDAYLWIVPAKVEGTWNVRYRVGAGEETAQVALTQTFQKFQGTAAIGQAKQIGVVGARLNGADIAFALDDGNGMRREFSGRVNGTRMEGSVKVGGTSAPFSATRIP